MFYRVDHIDKTFVISLTNIVFIELIPLLIAFINGFRSKVY